MSICNVSLEAVKREREMSLLDDLWKISLLAFSKAEAQAREKSYFSWFFYLFSW